ncbi:hypothetical protein [Companilactobacillus ginsenosidimutans]|uniref:Uncharacterized protein n=1 Tax=Companilactobacillus ginsenosidimutans TaxID=1007676 RepID=A0A0H4QFW0_9LACO|nr:hypothetical protein [Companilactobacillus ginsenosidimutans]AKP67304.1 hypothetical protein ABM34_06970 [Companilactobacillus ginsenosidimutans]
MHNSYMIQLIEPANLKVIAHFHYLVRCKIDGKQFYLDQMIKGENGFYDCLEKPKKVELFGELGSHLYIRGKTMKLGKILFEGYPIDTSDVEDIRSTDSVQIYKEIN